jgi:hypothetical protein
MQVNLASHELAQLGRHAPGTDFWLRNFPQEIANVIAGDCNPIYEKYKFLFPAKKNTPAS